MTATYPALTKLARAYLHPDFDEEYDDAGAAVADFLDGEPDLAPLLADEVRSALAAHPTEEQARAFVLEDLDSSYLVEADGLTYREWLRSVGERAGSVA